MKDGLARTGPLGDSHPARIALLSELAGQFDADGNLLEALRYREQEAAAVEAPPPPTPARAGSDADRGYDEREIGIVCPRFLFGAFSGPGLAVVRLSTRNLLLCTTDWDARRTPPPV